jgi:ketosteroid isomerase-like protein
MSVTANADLVLEVFHAIERRDRARVLSLCQPDVEFLWPPSLPYSGGGEGTWAQTWLPLQPTPTEQRMDPRVVAASEHEVVVLWQQRGARRHGERLDTPVLGLYQVRDQKLARAQMFYFDPVTVADFLVRASPSGVNVASGESS